MTPGLVKLSIKCEFLSPKKTMGKVKESDVHNLSDTEMHATV